MNATIEIDGKVIYYDNSGVGHNPRPATVENCGTDIQNEIAAKIIDHGVEECDDYTASNGLHYSW